MADELGDKLMDSVGESAETATRVDGGAQAGPSAQKGLSKLGGKNAKGHKTGGRNNDDKKADEKKGDGKKKKVKGAHSIKTLDNLPESIRDWEYLAVLDFEANCVPDIERNPEWQNRFDLEKFHNFKNEIVEVPTVVMARRSSISVNGGDVGDGKTGVDSDAVYPCTESSDADNESANAKNIRNHRVFFLLGQSNMVGRGKRDWLEAAPDLCDGETENVLFFFNNEGHIPNGPAESKAKDGYKLGMQISVSGDIEHFGPEMSLARELVKPEYNFAEKSKTILIKFGMGSTKIGEHWKPGGEHYKRLVAFIRQSCAEAMQMINEGNEDDQVCNHLEFSGVFFLQGESDSASSRNAGDHAPQMRDFVGHLREDLRIMEHGISADSCGSGKVFGGMQISTGVADTSATDDQKSGPKQGRVLPFVASQIHWPSGRKSALVNSGIVESCEKHLDFARWTSAEGLSVAEDKHLDSKSIIEVGRRLAKKWRDCCVSPSSNDASRLSDSSEYNQCSLSTEFGRKLKLGGPSPTSMDGVVISRDGFVMNRKDLLLSSSPRLLAGANDKLLDDFVVVDEFRSYVKPQFFPITEFCTALTGITQDDVDNVPPLGAKSDGPSGRYFAEVWQDWEEFMSKYEKVLIVTCGDADLRRMLPNQMNYSDMSFPTRDNDRHSRVAYWCNIKPCYEKVYEEKARGMAVMLKSLNLDLDGRHHSGIDDCRNTAKIVRKIILDAKEKGIPAKDAIFATSCRD